MLDRSWVPSSGHIRAGTHPFRISPEGPSNEVLAGGDPDPADLFRDVYLPPDVPADLSDLRACGLMEVVHDCMAALEVI